MKKVRRKGGNKEKVFGCDLAEHISVSCQDIPVVLRSCSEFIEENGIVDGIYRLSGVSSNTQKLRCVCVCNDNYNIFSQTSDNVGRGM
uniref:Rho-GAP domain-containing protein n=1 Tax=Denticeps clupeoides TaxID=299321 RepID=A0AAY4BNY6_9TELE